MKKKINWNLIYIYGLISIGVSLFLIYRNGVNTGDLYYYWLNTAYWCRGYSLEEIMQSGMVLEYLGKLEGVGILSYARLISNIIIPGFVSFKIVEIYTLILDLILVFLIIYNIRKYLQCNIILAGLTIFFPWYWSGYIRAFNIGGTLALMVVLAAFYVEKKENISAVLIALSLIKPQIGGIFLIALFLKKRYRLVTKILAIIIGSWIFDIIYIKNQSIFSSVIKIFSGYAGNEMEEERVATWFLQYGIFNLLRRIGVSNGIVLVLSAIAGIVYVVVLFNLISKNNKLNSDYVVIFAIAALASLFWFYKSECDSLVLILCNLLIYIYWKYSRQEWKDMAWVLIYLFGINCLVGRYFLRFGFHLLDYDEGMFVDQILQIILFYIMIYKIKKVQTQINYMNDEYKNLQVDNAYSL